jgi:streptogramin lyase
VQGGLSPVSGAAVTLYAAGTAYGASATNLGNTTTNGSGNFTIGFTPPATPAVLYLVALGGNAGSGSNTAIGLIGVAGMSNALPVSVTINELTTVAAEWALAQFIDSTGEVIGAPSSNATGFTNAVNQAQTDLVDVSTGAPATFWSNEGATAALCPMSASTACDGLERLDALGNILAACVESSGPSSTACSTLLSNTGGNTTTLGAAHTIAAKPMANYGTLSAPASPPFTPVLASGSDGFEIELNFAPAADFKNPENVAIDAAGNVWVPNSGDFSVTALTPSGGLLGNFTNTNTPGADFDGPNGVAIDTGGNVWMPNIVGNSVTELTSSGGLVGNFTPSGAAFSEPLGGAFDAAGNFWMTNQGGASVSELLAGCTTSSCTADNFNNTNTSGANFGIPIGVAIDSAGHVWAANPAASTLTALNNDGTLFGNFNNTNITGANFNGPRDVAIDAAGNVWVPNAIGSVTELLAGCATLSCTAHNFTPSGNNFNSPEDVAIDAAGNVWVTNVGGPPFGVTELTSSGALAGDFDPNLGAGFSEPFGVAIDSAGDVWVTNESGNSVTELIGVAKPVLTPLVACLKKATPHAVCLP